MDRRKNPIAVFDSGAGGISVLKELVKIMPGENYIYFGDSLNAPYGTKSTRKVRELTMENVAKLVDMGAKEVIVACNTATSAAVRPLREMYPLVSMVGIEPAIKPAAAEGGRVLVMATNLTLREEKLKRLTELYQDRADIILLPCSPLVEFVERGITNGEELDSYLKGILSPYINSVNSIVLGCTHFPLVKDAIQKAAGDVKLFDGGRGVAKQAKRLLERADLLSDGEKGTIKFISSLEGKEELYKRLFNF